MPVKSASLPFHLSSIVCVDLPVVVAHRPLSSSYCYIKTSVFCSLVKSQPGGAMPWYVVGCYYYVTKQFTSARQYFGKATSIDRNFAPAWVAFAQAFACQDGTILSLLFYQP